MFKKRAVNFKIVTPWPELVNKQIQKIENTLREVQFINHSEFLLAKGVIRRQVRYFDDYGRSRKTDDYLHFEIVLDETGEESSSLLNAVIKQDYFIFQPGRTGANQALLEQGFTLLVFKEESFFKKQTVTIFTKTIIAKGKENSIFNFLITLPETCIEPKYFAGKVFFDSQNLPPIIHGEIKGIVTYRSSKNMLCEMEFAEAISILSDLSTLNKEESLLIEGEITDFSWKKSSSKRDWILEIKIEYRWKLIRKKILKCLTADESGKKAVFKIKTSLLSKSDFLEISRTFSFPAFSMPITEVKVSVKKHHEKITTKGLLAHIFLLIEIYTINDGGYETYQEYNLEFDELIPGLCLNQASPSEQIITEIKARFIKSYISNNLINLDLLFEFFINIYRDELVEISESENSQNELILAEVFVESKVFSLLGESILMLRRQPEQIVKVAAKMNCLNNEIKMGWISINCQMEVAVSYLDKERRFREDIFIVPGYDSFLWNKLGASDKIVLQSRLDYDSYTLSGEKLYYKFILSFFAELFTTREIMAATTTCEEKMVTGSRPDCRSQIQSVRARLPVNNNLTQIPIEGEVVISLGNPKEIGDVKIFLVEFKCYRLLESIFLEGKVKSEIEYWDNTGYLRREIGHFSFLRLLRNDFDLAKAFENVQPKIHEYSYFIRNGQGMQKRSLKVIANLECIPTKRG